MEENLARLHVYYDKVASPGSAAPLHDRVMARKVRTLRCSFSNSCSELKFFSGPKNWSCGFPTINLSNTVFMKDWRLSRLRRPYIWLQEYFVGSEHLVQTTEQQRAQRTRIGTFAVQS
jgi:hypothetical protein